MTFHFPRKNFDLHDISNFDATLNAAEAKSWTKLTLKTKRAMLKDT